MNLANKIKTIYPQITDDDLRFTIILKDDGAGPHIAAWNYPGLSQPTDAQLASLENEPDPPPFIDPISDRQFAQQLAVVNMITQAEALAWVKVGTAPAAIQAWVDALPSDQQFSAQMILCGATQFFFAHPMTAAFFAQVGMNDAARAQFWRAAGAL